MNYIYAAAIALLCGFTSGYFYRDKQDDKAQVAVLQSDAVELPKVEKKDDDRKAKIITIYKTIEANAVDCLVQPWPDSVIDGLRAGGVKTGF